MSEPTVTYGEGSSLLDEIDVAVHALVEGAIQAEVTRRYNAVRAILQAPFSLPAFEEQAPKRKTRKDKGVPKLGKSPLSGEELAEQKSTQHAKLEPVPILQGAFGTYKACAICRANPHAMGDVRCSDCRSARLKPTPEQLAAFEAAVVTEET